jgi:hypothetical protein
VSLANCCAICLPREKEIWGASIRRLINEGRNKCGYFLQQRVSDSTVRLEKLREYNSYRVGSTFTVVYVERKSVLDVVLPWLGQRIRELVRGRLDRIWATDGKQYGRHTDWLADVLCLSVWLADWLSAWQTPFVRVCFKKLTVPQLVKKVDFVSSQAQLQHPHILSLGTYSASCSGPFPAAKRAPSPHSIRGCVGPTTNWDVEVDRQPTSAACNRTPVPQFSSL